MFDAYEIAMIQRLREWSATDMDMMNAADMLENQAATIASLREALAVPVMVKTLVWSPGSYVTTDDDGGPREGTPRRLMAWRASGYTIIKQDSPHGLWLLRTPTGKNQIASPHFSECQAAAQADHEARILAAIDGGPQ